MRCIHRETAHSPHHRGDCSLSTLQGRLSTLYTTGETSHPPNYRGDCPLSTLQGRLSSLHNTRETVHSPHYRGRLSTLHTTGGDCSFSILGHAVRLVGICIELHIKGTSYLQFFSSSQLMFVLASIFVSHHRASSFSSIGNVFL